MNRLILSAAATFLALAPPVRAQEHGQQLSESQQLGQVSFPTSCVPEVQADFERAVALLHSFWYGEAEGAFRAVTSEDPDCAMAYWGVAMSRYHQLWERPGPKDVRAGREALQRAREVERISARERAYVAALQRFYHDVGTVDHRTRALAYEEAMRELHERYPHDGEGAIFYALALLGTASSSAPDPAFARQNAAADILERMLASQPDHPGVAHYLIHSSDYPPLAKRGLEAARRYAEIAPDAPHALHMPSHIFTRLGLWEESIASNRAASAAARKAGWTGEELHTTDYLTYAYLQGARDREAGRLVERLPARSAELSTEDTNYGSGLYATAVIPARFALERRRWPEAAALEVPRDVLPGGIWCWAEGPLHLARGLGAVHTGDFEAARQSMTELEDCRDFLLQGEEQAGPRSTRVNVTLWANRLEVQRRTLAGVLALAEGQEDEALALLRSASELEDAGDKPPTTPGSVVPARELLGEMLLDLEQPAGALAEFERTLVASPNRFRTLYGAARAARMAGQLDRARESYTKLLETSRSAEGDRPELEEARSFLGIATAGGPAPAARPDAKAEDVESIDAILGALYDVISGPAGKERDWDRFRSLFLPEARLISTGNDRDGKPSYQAWSVEDYVTRAGPFLTERGFHEREIGRVTETFGHIAHAFTAYESRWKLEDPEPFQRGINSVQLYHDGDRWWIVTVMWDSERPGSPIPERYLHPSNSRDH